LAWSPLLILALVLALAGLRPDADSSRQPPARAAAGSVGLPVAQSLSPEQLAGERVVYSYTGLRPPRALLGLIRAGDAAGVIFFADNVSSATQVRAVVGQLQRAALSSPLHTRLLLMTDQEGGEVRRLPGAPTWSEKQIGESADGAMLARAAGSGAGRNLASAGINVNLAPVLDVYRRAGNFIDQFGRSYSTNAARVAALGAAFVSSQQRDGVAATAKHFPGLGAASRSQNTDLGPVTLRLSLRTLRSVDEAPYRIALSAGVKLVMTSWAVYPALDPHRPAGLSPIVIQGELRRRLGFRGVTITDGIDAAAVTPFGGLARRGVLAAAAGADLILCAATNPADNSPSLGLTVLHAITSALSGHQLSRSASQQSADRVLALRARP
jgi:beta-N-acetylhexosaminidase